MSGDEGSGRVDYVDILTDTDGDGVGDVNERIAGTAENDAASVPGASVIDVLALFNDGYRERFRGDTRARIHHVMVVTGAIFADSGTNIRLRTVGMHLVELDEHNRLPEEERVELMERQGADATLRFHDGPSGSCLGCAGLGGVRASRLLARVAFCERGRVDASYDSCARARACLWPRALRIPRGGPRRLPLVARPLRPQQGQSDSDGIRVEQAHQRVLES